MGTLKTKVNSDFLEAFKSKNTLKKNLLSVVKGEIQTVEKNSGEAELSDEGVTKILNKMVKSLNETITQSGDETAKEELIILSSYLPKQMSYQEIKDKIKDVLAESGKDFLTIGEVMKAFAKDPVDKKLVAQVFEEN